jgi:hypothetical protein
MDEPIFITTFSSGVKRAVPGADGSWEVEELLAGLPVTCLASDPRDSRRIYAGTRQQGIWRSDDCGRTWDAAGLRGPEIKSLAASPHDPNLLYAGAKGALLYHSQDGGKSWAELEGFRDIPNRWWWFSPAEPPDRRPYINAIAPSPADPDVLLAGIEFGAVVRSQDGGRSWSRHRRGALRDCHSLKFHAANGDWAYEAGDTGGGASFSRDGGRSWQKSNRGFAKKYGVVCGADPESPEVWYACVAPSPFKAFSDKSEAYLYRSTGGAGWQPIGWTDHPLTSTPTALVTLPGKPGQLYAGLYNGEVWHSADYGDSWRRMPFNLGGVWFSMIVIDGKL